MQDPTEFRKRFLLYKEGKMPYENGLPKYLDGRRPMSHWDKKQSTSYRIPFIPEKRIKLTNAGLATGAILSTNLLDSIADNAYKANIPIKTAIGLATKESTLGNPTDDTTIYKLLSDPEKIEWFKQQGTGQHINNGKSVEEQSLVNYHKGDTDHSIFKGDNNESILKTAFDFYKENPDKYNPGLKNYQKLVNKRGDEVMNSPEVLKWYKEWEDKLIQIKRPEPYKIKTTIQNTAAPKFGSYKNGKLPGFQDGRIGHNVSRAKMNNDSTFTDDYTKLFEDMYITPQKTDLKRGSYTLNNFPYYLQHRTDWTKPFMSSATNEKGLETISPEFDLLFGGRQITTSLLPKKPTAAKIKTPVDKYTLDWLNWSRGGDISPEHLKEYSEIIKAHKDTPSWLLMDDGSYFRGDPRSWVLLMSESAKKAGLREGRFPSYTNIGYSGVDRTIDPQYTGILWFSRNPLTGRSFARNDAHVLEMAYPWPKHVSTVNAGGNYWPAIFKTDKGRLLETNDLVNFSVNPKSPLEIKNVYELGPNFVLKSKYKTPDFNYGTSFVSDDIILYPDYPRKSILYNNGEFDLTNHNMYYKDGKLPFFSNGKASIHIKPANRGKFNATKKRTGKTTEELAHSKNPLTRKRAIFALNARKWKH